MSNTIDINAVNRKNIAAGRTYTTLQDREQCALRALRGLADRGHVLSLRLLLARLMLAEVGFTDDDMQNIVSDLVVMSADGLLLLNGKRLTWDSPNDGPLDGIELRIDLVSHPSRASN